MNELYKNGKAEWGAWLTRIILVALMGILINNAEQKSNSILLSIANLSEKIQRFEVDAAKQFGINVQKLDEYGRRITKLEEKI